MKLNKYIDHTLLKADATKKEIQKLCDEAKEFNFATVCINPTWIETVKGFLKNSEVKITTVIGFPLGANTLETKVFETEQAVKNGADEIDMVINIGLLKDKKYDVVLKEIQAIRMVTKNKILKVILETCFLTKEEIIKACQLAIEAQVDFVKTSTGFGTSGANEKDIEIMKQTVNNKVKVKASGGIKTLEDALKMIEKGADRLGTSSGVIIIKN